MKAKFNNSIFAVLVLTTLMSCTTSRNATAQYPNSSDEYGDYDNGYANNAEDEYYDEPSEADVNINVFVNELSPYGRWVNSPSYGQVWICNEAGFTPYYSRGHWAYTSYGWTWASDYRWGWAPFHYGRWTHDPFYGWMWVPGYQWGPAWVGWRTGGDYYGWAPLGPGMNISIGFNFGGIAANNWCFVPRRYIGYSNFNRYAVNRSRNVTIIRNTTIINNTNIYRNTRYATGPNRTEVERFTGRRVNELRINNRPGASRVTNNNTINIYRPQVNKKEVTRNNVNINKKVDVDKRVNNNNQSHDADNPNRNPRIIRTPEMRNDNNRQQNIPDQRDRINDNRNSNNRDVNRDNNNDQRKDNDIRNKPPQQNDNRFQERNFNNRNQQQNNRQDNNKPLQNWNDRNNQDRNLNQRPDFNRSQNQNRSFDQKPDFNKNRNNGRTWQPAPQQQRNAPVRPAPQQNTNKRRPA